MNQAKSIEIVAETIGRKVTESIRESEARTRRLIHALLGGDIERIVAADRAVNGTPDSRAECIESAKAPAEIEPVWRLSMSQKERIHAAIAYAVPDAPHNRAALAQRIFRIVEDEE